MKTVVLTIRREPYYRRAAFEQGLKRHGYAILGHTPGLRPKSKRDLLVLWNRKRGADDQAATQWEQHGGTVIITENAYLQKVDKTMYAISVHGHNGSGWFPVGNEDRFSKLGFNLKPMQCNLEGHWLVCAQRSIGSPLMASPPQWAEKTVEKLRRSTGLKIRLRPHPGNFKPKVDLLDDLRGAHACLVWASGAGVRALVEGIPTEYSAPHWICQGPGTREEKLHRMAHGQWHHEEIATGEPFARILDSLENAKW